MTIDQIKQEISRIDYILDNSEISDEEFVKLNLEAQRLQFELGSLEKKLRFESVDEIHPNDWTKNFLNSFGTKSVTRVITLRQYEVFRKINFGKPFKFSGVRYNFGANSRFAHLIITKL